MLFAGFRAVRARPGGRPSTLVALGSAAAAALAGAVVWGVLALLIHRQLSLVGLAIGVAVGGLVSRFRPGHLPTIVAGGVIAVAGCALGTLLGQIFLLLEARDSLPLIASHLGIVLRAYPGNVGALGALFYLIAAYSAVSVPLRSRKLAGGSGPADAAAGPAASPAAEADG
jgi:hypothetical protein